MSDPAPITINEPSDWTYREPARVEKCPDCGGVRLIGPWPHSPHWRTVKGRTFQVDCIGREVVKALT